MATKYGEKKYEVVISGLSGIYPECDDIEELWTRLMNKEDMVTIDGRRWDPGEFDVPPGTGKVKNPEHFDMPFFGIHKKLCEKMDPYTRLLCEQGYRAICDAGVNHRDLDGTNTAVIVGSVTSEPTLDAGATLANQGSYNVLAFSRTMQANRLSYFLNARGPSFQMDNTSSAGIQALKYACDLISTGMCTAAIVGATSLLYKAEGSFHFKMMGRLSDDSVTRCFSSDASGFARSEACVAVFLQRKEHAKRIYGTVVESQITFHGTKTSSYLDFPRGKYEDFLVDTYRNANVNPKDVVYVEANGAASKILDAEELNGLSKALTKERSEPLLVGSIKSNLGHAESAAFMVSLTKALMAMDRGIIPPNINYLEPNPLVPDLISGKLKVVTEPTPIEGGYIGVCDITMVGGCGHVILKAHEKIKSSDNLPGAKLPYLITMSGRSDTFLEKTMKAMDNNGINDEFTVLINSLYKDGIKNHRYRGYSVANGGLNTYSKIEPAPGGEPRPIWFMYSGMGSQWPTMAKSLMALPIFAKAITKCHKVLEPKGVNLLDIVCKDDPTLFDTILNSFVGIAAVQIGLTDVLRAVGVVPDGIIGHSVGELGCAYADGCMTAEQMVLAAHARGRASIEATLIKGMMAAVGAGYKDMKDVIPATIEVACHNSKESCTLSGPAEDMAAYISQLKGKGMFAKLVNVANIAYHSRYIKPAAPALLKYLKEIIPVPMKRSSKWVSSSNLECNWKTELAQYSSAEYHTNNLLSAVLFEEASSHIPSDAIVIEIAPHGLMQAIVKRSLPQAVHIPMTSRFDRDNLMFFLSAIGKMFLAGIPVDLQALYPAVEFPVSRGTPPISPMIDWLRETNFFIKRDLGVDPDATSPQCRFISINRRHNDFDGLMSNKIIGRSIIPASFYFNEIIAHFTSLVNNENVSVIIEDFKFVGYTEISSITSTDLRFQLLKGRGKYTVSNSETNKVILEGNVKAADLARLKELTVPEASNEVHSSISHEDMMNLMKTYGVERDATLVYTDNVVIEESRVFGTAHWDGNIGKFLMALLAVVELYESKTTNVLKLFHSAGEIIINLPFLRNSEPKSFLVEYDIFSRKLQCEGVKIGLIECRNPGLGQNDDKDFFISFELPHFIPYANSSLFFNECITTCTQLVLENTILAHDTVLKITEIGANPELHDALMEISTSTKYTGQTSLSLFPTYDKFLQECTSSLLQKNLWVVCAELPSLAALKTIASINDGFLLSPTIEVDKLEKTYTVIFETKVDGKGYTLYAIRKPITRQYEVVDLSSNYLPILENQLLMARGSMGLTPDVVKTVILRGQVESIVDVENLLEETKDLPNSQLLHYWLFFGNSPDVNFNDSKFKGQIERDVRMNILKDGQWGSFRLIPSVSEKALDSERSMKFCYRLSEIVVPSCSCNDPCSTLALGLNLDDSSAEASIPDLGCYDYVNSSKMMGVGAYDPKTKLFTTDPFLNWQKPSQWTSKEAASVPLLYSQASFILHHMNNVHFTYENSILVNRALLPLSQAIISLAIFENMNIHATVYGEDEKQKLLKWFPKLNPKNIYDCSTSAFFVDFLKNTNGGVYKVINSFDDPGMIQPCMECVLEQGVIIYASQTLLDNGSVMGMSKFEDQTIAKGISNDILLRCSEDVKIQISHHIVKALQGGGVVPIRSVASLPPSMLNTEAVAYLKSNPNKVVVETKDVGSGLFIQDNKIQVIIEGKNNLDISLDILEWLLKRGSRKVLLFVKQSHPSGANLLRLQTLRDQYSAEIDLHPYSQLSSKLQVEKFIEEWSAQVPSMIFFLGSGLKERIEFFDEILSQKSPECNMICIGKGGETVCERRKKNSLPALYIRCSTANLEGVNLVQYLDSLIKDSPKTPVVLVKKCAIQNKSLHGLLADLAYVPDTTDNLNELMSQSKVSKASFVEIISNAPPTAFNYDVYPMFLIPGLRPNRLHKMASQLFCPVMEARIPANASSIEQMANELAAELLAFPHNMYTLCAEGWGGILALHVAAKLEAASKYVLIVLLDANPASIKKWAENLLKNEMALFRKYLQLPPRIEPNVKNSTWDEEIKFAIDHSPIRDEELKLSAINSLRMVRTRLRSVFDAKPPSRKLKAICNVFVLNTHADEDHGLGDYLVKGPIMRTKDSKTSDVMIDEDVSVDIDQLLLFEHKDAANPPIEEYLGCNVVKKYFRHWQSSLLNRIRE